MQTEPPLVVRHSTLDTHPVCYVLCRTISSESPIILHPLDCANPLMTRLQCSSASNFLHHLLNAIRNKPMCSTKAHACIRNYMIQLYYKTFRILYNHPRENTWRSEICTRYRVSQARAGICRKSVGRRVTVVPRRWKISSMSCLGPTYSMFIMRGDFINAGTLICALFFWWNLLLIESSTNAMRPVATITLALMVSFMYRA